MAVKNRLSYREALLTTVVVVLVIFAGATLFATEQQETIQVAQISTLDGDIDNSGNQDGLVATLALLLAPVVVASLDAVVGFVVMVNRGLLLALCEPQKLSSAEWVLALERPG
jgi:Fe2+ transport system protein B